jgi:hypothetical protein
LETLILTSDQRKSAFIKLGKFLATADEELNNTIQSSQYTNAWFTPEQVQKAISANAKMLSESSVNQWFAQYHEYISETSQKRIGLILAGNIPMVGFHDILCVLAAGHIALIKLSSQDKKLIPYLLQKLSEFEPGFSDQFQFIERLEGFDAVIATGSNNSSRYFDYYFSKVPHIIRKNRNSISILSGEETTDQLHALGNDIFSYYGLGCRNVSKLFVPENYDFNTFFESIQSFEPIANHHKYNNNYDYNKSIYLVNRVAHLDNGFLLVKEDETLTSPLSVLYYEQYKDEQSLKEKLNSISAQIQCTVTSNPLDISIQQVSFGQSQEPELWDYADGIDTMKFLLSI